MSLAINVVEIDVGTKKIHLIGTLTASGSYVTGGDTLDFTTVAAQLSASQAPVQVWLAGSTGDAFAWVKGTALNNQKAKINTASNTELSSGAYPARITGDTGIQFEAVFNKLI